MTSLNDLVNLTQNIISNSNFDIEKYNKPGLENKDLDILCNEFYINENLDTKIDILNILCRYYYDICFEILQKTNIQYIFNPNISSNFELVLKIVKESTLPVELKYETAKLIYEENKENNENNIAYGLFLFILKSDDIHNIHSLIRVQILGYLLETNAFKTETTDIFRNFIRDETLTQSFKYKTILEYIENKNIKKDYLIDIFTFIFNNRVFRTRFLILSAQVVLGFDFFEKEHKCKVEDTMLVFCQDNNLDFNLRADACDLLLTFSNSEHTRQIALDTIILLGREETGVNRGIYSVYDDKQNVHNQTIDKSVKDILCFLSSIQLETKNGKYTTYDETCKEIIEIYCKTYNIEMDKKYLQFYNLNENETDTSKNNEYDDDNDYICDNTVLKNLELIRASFLRFSLDRGLYTNFQSIQTLFIKIWSIIKSHEHSNSLTLRLFEELIDMSGSCTSGHISRIVNVLSGFEINGKLINLSIDYKDEMTSNMIAKLNKKILEISDEEYKYNITEEMLWTSNYEGRIHFNKFFRENVMEIRDELYNEYVANLNLLDNETFEINFRQALMKFEY
jgi:hypothetical protein